MVAGLVSIAILPASVAAAPTIDPPALPWDPEPVACFLGPGPEESPACSVTIAPAPAVDAGPRTLVLDIESRVTSGEANRPPVSRAGERLTSSSTRPPARLEYSGRAWPFAVGVAADALTTQWAVGRGCFERNPLLGVGRLDLAMVKMVQFPLLALAVDALERRHPRLGHGLRWATLAFHGALAFHNVRMGLAAGRPGTAARPPGSPSAAPR
ncbi:MAG: hypothetical protein DMF78_18565 [Acidobacteria bacterium]|nr:MAG: hypothetical protein DMF78_18565 [Acidobacteriota bacterium]